MRGRDGGRPAIIRRRGNTSRVPFHGVPQTPTAAQVWTDLIHLLHPSPLSLLKLKLSPSILRLVLSYFPFRGVWHAKPLISSPPSKMSRNRYELTPEQLALAEARRQKRMHAKENTAPKEDPRSKILAREWLQIGQPQADDQRVKVMTWNVCSTSCCQSQITVDDTSHHVRCLRNALSVSCIKASVADPVKPSAIGRELFPTSDCLKAAQREHMLYKEILSHRADICCLQVGACLTSLSHSTDKMLRRWTAPKRYSPCWKELATCTSTKLAPARSTVA